MPWGTKQPRKRGLGVAAVWARAVEAGIMASRRGSARVAPAPRRTVRREMCFLVMNIIWLCSLILKNAAEAACTGGGFDCIGWFHVGLEWGAFYYAHYDCG